MGTAPPEKSTAQRQKVKHVRETFLDAVQSKLYCSGGAERVRLRAEREGTALLSIISSGPE